jgi:hypothetical protein
MTDRFATTRNALAMCDVCGFQYKLRDLKSLVVKGKNTNIRACWECWNEDHPQLKLGEFPIRDPQAIRNPRPDTSLAPAGRFSSRGEQWGWSPVGGGPTAITPNNLVGTSKIGVVTV